MKTSGSLWAYLPTAAIVNAGLGQKATVGPALFLDDTVNPTFSRPQLDFVPLQGTEYWRMEPCTQKQFYARSSDNQFHSSKLYHSLYIDETYNSCNASLNLSYNFVFQDTRSFSLNVSHNYVGLSTPFNPNQDETNLIPLDQYPSNTLLFTFNPNSRKHLSFSPSSNYGGHYVGNLAAYEGIAFYCFQSFVRMGLKVQLSQLIIPQPILDDNLMHIWPSIEISKSAFITYLFQLNKQTSILFLSTCFAHLSDDFIVYNHNFGQRESKHNRSAFTYKTEQLTNYLKNQV